MIVLAQVVSSPLSAMQRHRFVLEEVGGVRAKVEAIANDGGFDTIVVAGKNNKEEAEDVLFKLKKLGPIRVKNLEDASND